MASRNNSLFSSREQRIDFPSALIKVNDSMLEMSGFIRSPRPCTLEERLPPSVNVSAPVCFCAMPHCFVSSA